SVQVVDGQQRLSTFQLFLAALRHIATEWQQESIVKALDVYIFNDERSAEADASLADRLKLVPTPADRAIFRDLMTESFATVRVRHSHAFYKNGNIIKGQAPRALLAYLYFREKIDHYAAWGSADLDDDEALSIEQMAAALAKSDPAAGQRLQALADALLIQFKLVIINLEEGDDAQVIFETLNSRGEPLLAMDLVRNNIFHRAEAQGEQPEALFESRWKPFDQLFWKEDAPRAKPKRPRIDHFLSYALTAQTGEETSLRELYAEYRSFARPKGKARFATVGDELDALLRFNPVYEALERGTGDPDIAWLGRKLATWEVATVYPLVFATAVADMDDAEKRAIYRLIYSYIVRRAICGLSAKNLNKNFTRIVSIFNERGASLESFRASFAGQSGPTVRFPDDAELLEAIEVQPIYQNILRAERLIDILWELEKAVRSKFQVDDSRPSFLSIEHVLPQTWTTHWPLPDGRFVPATRIPADEEMAVAMRHRDAHRHRLGNLTLVTTPLNSSMQNQNFDAKRERLGKSLMALNTTIASSPSWDEEAIAGRAAELGKYAVTVWPNPNSC
ncbi:DUF262 domain-containing protein, partial [Allosphingosinicella sp.]|uniref:DUF262 domain-containing protein n=1 Tax=Allosphingosinicella sp. TaxID=2823234 RepID=UPI00378451CC